MSALPRPLVAALAALAALLVLGAAPAPAADPVPGVDAAAVPAAARDWLPLIADLTATGCPELPPVWVVAQVQVESGWDTALVDDAPGGPAGLYGFGQEAWRAAGGAAWSSDPPTADDDVTDVEAHLRVAVPWICTNLRAVTRHLADTGKTADPLDAMLVCHLAGCGRVAGSATGVPVTGEAGCGERCAEVVRRYVDAVRAEVDRFSGAAPGPAPDAPGATTDPGVPAPWTGGATGCEQTDPTGDGCLTGAALHGLEEAAAAFGGWSDGPVIRSAGCWDAHAWNPRSDHPRGRACDLFPGTPGAFAEGAGLEAGWRVADWFRAHAGPLAVRYLIWQGRYWDPSVEDDGGWGRRYTGGGVYDTRDATGGHFDHVHVSFRE
ncbi:hypothetical protein [Pseudonocardia oceani]|uniref:ARB-07466-like C-terminal domain-containing protein n=1 Tax=Pseudonocardia oceani TaxID=2792013 RepID=A0ABS6UAY6_9PSEU|nr:hypothetical protein [Pseudonocardia oceani]MBW0129392.1 hypothetical protein [Pseudonocardia oceani]